MQFSSLIVCPYPESWFVRKLNITTKPTLGHLVITVYYNFWWLHFGSSKSSVSHFINFTVYLQLVDISNILSYILFHRILNAMVGFSRVFQVLATCKKVRACKVRFLKVIYNSSGEKRRNHFGDGVRKYVLN